MIHNRRWKEIEREKNLVYEQDIMRVCSCLESLCLIYLARTHVRKPANVRHCRCSVTLVIQSDKSLNNKYYKQSLNHIEQGFDMGKGCHGFLSEQKLQ
jgi:hypothetical protein